MLICERWGEKGACAARPHGPPPRRAVQGPRLCSTRRLVEEARERGLDVAIIDPLTCSMFVDEGRVEVLVNGEPFEHEAVIPRIGHSITGHGTALLRHLDQLGVWSSNSAAGILQSRDKLRASQILAGTASQFLAP